MGARPFETGGGARGLTASRFTHPLTARSTSRPELLRSTPGLITKRADFEHTGQVPGRKIEYRVKAKRPSGDSQYSNVAVVYDLELAKAA